MKRDSYQVTDTPRMAFCKRWFSPPQCIAMGYLLYAVVMSIAFRHARVDAGGYLPEIVRAGVPQSGMTTAMGTVDFLVGLTIAVATARVFESWGPFRGLNLGFLGGIWNLKLSRKIAVVLVLLLYYAVAILITALLRRLGDVQPFFCWFLPTALPILFYLAMAAITKRPPSQAVR